MSAELAISVKYNVNNYAIKENIILPEVYVLWGTFYTICLLFWLNLRFRKNRTKEWPEYIEDSMPNWVCFN